MSASACSGGVFGWEPEQAALCIQQVRSDGFSGAAIGRIPSAGESALNPTRGSAGLSCSCL